LAGEGSSLPGPLLLLLPRFLSLCFVGRENQGSNV
jgi:hypothetical protein